MKKLFLIFIIILNIALTVQAIDDSVVFINRTNAGTTIEKYFMQALPQNLSDSQVNIKEYNVDVQNLNEIEIIIKFSVNSDGLYPIIIGFDKDDFSIQSIYLNGILVDIDRLVYDNFFFCDPNYEKCEDKEINTNGIVTFQGPKGMNIRGYPILSELGGNNLHELKFTLKNTVGNIGNSYPFENYFYDYSIYIPAKRTIISNFIISTNNHDGNATFIIEKSDYKKSKLVDAKFTNYYYSSIPLKASENSLQLDIQPSEELIYSNNILMKQNISLKNSNKHIHKLIFILTLAIVISLFVGYQYGSKQKGKEIALLTIGTSVIFSIIFSLLVPLEFLFNIYMISLILSAYVFMFISLKIGSKIRDGSKN